MLFRRTQKYLHIHDLQTEPMNPKTRNKNQFSVRSETVSATEQLFKKGDHYESKWK